MFSTHRRRFLASLSKAALVAAGASLVPSRSWALPDALSVPAGRSVEKIRGFPFEELDSFLTPTGKFFLRSHLEIPRIDPRSFRLQVGGWVERPVSMTLKEVEGLTSLEMPATFECSGSPVGGGMVSTAQWSGVRLWPLLEKARPKPGAVEVVMEGADAGLDELVPVPVQYARSVPLSLLGDLPGILATRMNGEPLLPEHGFPLRAVLPGLYGMQNVKWLIRLTVVNRPFTGFYQTQRYVGLRRVPRGIRIEQVLRQRVKSQIARIVPLEGGGRGKYQVSGAAWSGGQGVASVEISVNGGRDWQKAQLASAPNGYSWALWRHEFSAGAGTHEVIARATDGAGKIQPLDKDPSDLAGYFNNWCDRRKLTVPS